MKGTGGLKILSAVLVIFSLTQAAHADWVETVSYVGSADFSYKPWGKYLVTTVNSKAYFAGYAVNNSISHGEISTLSYNQLHAVLLNDNYNRSVPAGGILTLSEGYALKVKDVDVGGKIVLLSLLKDGNEIDTTAIQVGNTYVYSKRIGNVSDLPIIAVHLSSLYSNTTFWDGIFQLSEGYYSGGSISVSSSPSGASVYLDGSYLGITPRTITGISIGSHTITVRLTGYQDSSQTGNVTRVGSTSYVTAALKSLSPITSTQKFTFTMQNNTALNFENGYYIIEVIEIARPLYVKVYMSSGGLSRISSLFDRELPITFNEIKLSSSSITDTSADITIEFPSGWAYPKKYAIVRPVGVPTTPTPTPVSSGFIVKSYNPSIDIPSKTIELAGWRANPNTLSIQSADSVLIKITDFSLQYPVTLILNSSYSVNLGTSGAVVVTFYNKGTYSLKAVIPSGDPNILPRTYAEATITVSATTSIPTATVTATTYPQSRQIHNIHVGPGTAGLNCDACHGFPPVVPPPQGTCNNCHPSGIPASTTPAAKYITPIPDTSPPSISISKPQIVDSNKNGQLDEGEKLVITYGAIDDSGIKSIRVLLDGNLIEIRNKEDIYSVTTDSLSMGEHSIVVEAIDSKENKKFEEMKINVVRTGPSVYFQKTRYEVSEGEDVNVVLSAVNPIGNPKMDALLILKPPGNGVSTYESDCKGYSGQCTGKFEIEPGDSVRSISVRMKAEKAGEYPIDAEVYYQFENQRSPTRYETITLVVKPKPQAPSPAQAQSIPGFEAGAAIALLVGMRYLKNEKRDKNCRK